MTLSPKDIVSLMSTSLGPVIDKRSALISLLPKHLRMPVKKLVNYNDLSGAVSDEQMDTMIMALIHDPDTDFIPVKKKKNFSAILKLKDKYNQNEIK